MAQTDPIPPFPGNGVVLIHNPQPAQFTTAWTCTRMVIGSHPSWPREGAVERACNLGSTYLSRTRRDLIAVIGGGATDWSLAARAQKPGRTVPRSLLARADEVIE
jgi:hypothetical protein